MVASFIKYIKYFFIPSFCQYCRKLTPENTVFCSCCINMIPPIVSTTIRMNRIKSFPVFALSLYEEPIKSLIIAKAGGRRLASKQLGILIVENTFICKQEFDYIIPIPLHWIRFAYRGYNQAEVIGEQISNATGKPILNALKRIHVRPFQAKIAIDERYKNVEGVFELNKTLADQLKDKHLLLVDDLMTTGSTLKEAAKMLYAAHPASIKAVVGARI